MTFLTVPVNGYGDLSEYAGSTGSPLSRPMSMPAYAEKRNRTVFSMRPSPILAWLA